VRQEPGSPGAADANADGQVDISDPIATLEVLFTGGKALPPPYPEPGKDLRPGRLPCRAW
jgi:hypothetical protein